MLTAFIKYLFIYFFCTYICTKSHSSFRISLVHHILLSTSLTIISCFLEINYRELNYILPLLLFWLIMCIYHPHPQTTFIICTISFTICLCIFAITNLLSVIILLPLFRQHPNHTIIALIAGIIHSVLIKGLLSTKRFCKGLSILLASSFVNLTTLLCLFVIGGNLYISLDYKSNLTKNIGLFSFIISLAFLIYWWQAQITKAYRRNLELRELESMRTEMAELKLKMQELTDENERLARITHRDNTLISALKNATVKYLSTDFANPTVALETRDQLLENINTLSAGRNSLADTHKEKSSRKFETGLKLLDALLHEMDEKALEMNISFAVHMGTSLDNFIPEEISEEDLVHTVDDLLKNAFKATTSCEKRMVQLQFYKLGKHFVVEVADTGIPFEVKSLVNMGIEKLTTYEDGSGIGLVDIWTTKEKYGATYHLDECINAAPFSKKVSLTFDKKNRYSIRTLRKDEILQMSRRADLQVYDYNEQ